ncbi:uncharacterized protein JCM15063_000379 [Sporobolomyces koalae]|uniref:uncharacterized protein n=1 Tax=Sporobolomyces koalae TaxID=500713 RepID=UPI00317A429E
MDQDQFRQLLSTSTSTSRPASSRFGQAPPKRSLSAHDSKAKPTDFKPRPAGGKSKLNKPSKPSADESRYRDRAAERRAGKDGDFAQAEKLLEDFEQRARSERDEEERKQLEQQRQYLGGDATHSILVKGLDMALLERNKAQLAQQEQDQLEDVELLLDQQLEHPVAPSTTTKKNKKTKSRDELLQELKASRGSSETNSGLGKGWKKLGATSPTEVEQPQKKLRKKKKKPTTTTTTTSSTSIPPPPPVAPEEVTSKPIAPTATTAASSNPPDQSKQNEGNDDDDDDDDIFGDAGSYKGYDSESDASDPDGSNPSKAPTTTTIKRESSLPPPSALNKRKYFEDEEDQEEEQGRRVGESTAPGSMSDLASRQASHLAASSSHNDNDDDDNGEDGQGSTVTKLVPLSGSRGPSVKELLELDKLAEQEEKRKAKKLKRQESKDSGNDKKSNLNEADRANRDYLQMEAYLARKKQTE